MNQSRNPREVIVVCVFLSLVGFLVFALAEQSESLPNLDAPDKIGMTPRNSLEE